jgi:hypothetical protein
MPETTEVTALRLRLGEAIPEGGTSADTLFSEEQLQAIVDTTDSSDAAALEGWEIKRAHLANLVNITDGAAARELGQLFEHANEMVDDYSRKINGRIGRTRIGRITRS